MHQVKAILFINIHLVKINFDRRFYGYTFVHHVRKVYVLILGRISPSFKYEYNDTEIWISPIESQGIDIPALMFQWCGLASCSLFALIHCIQHREAHDKGCNRADHSRTDKGGEKNDVDCSRTGYLQRVRRSTYFQWYALIPFIAMLRGKANI